MRGKPLTVEKLCRILWLLANTDMPISDIAESCGVHPSTVICQNAKHGIRQYAGKRTNWKGGDRQCGQ